jgi:hypothetical protein
MSKWYRSNQAIGVYLCVALGLLLAYMLSTSWVFRETRDGFLLGFFPLLGVAGMLLCAFGLVIDPLRREIPEDLEDLALADVAKAIVMLIGIGVYFATMRDIGFLLVTPVFLFVYMFWFGLRPLKQTVLLAIAIPVGIYVLFSVIGVRLPNGILPAFI